MRFLLALLLAFPQDKPKGVHPKVDQAKVDEAIQKGCKVLIGGGSAFGTFPHGKRHQPEAMQAYGELLLLTLLHSGYYTGEEPALQPIVSFCLEREISSTYTASLGAMAFQKLDARKYQARIAEYAQFLCDNQAENGQWDYGAPVPKMDTVPTGKKPKPPAEDVASGGGTPGAAPAPKKSTGKTEALPRIPVRKRKPGPPNGDNSNAQYAALGLRSCLDAGIDVDPKVLTQARKWWMSSQNSDGGWGYNGEGSQGGEDNPTSVSNTSYGSMTVGAVGAMCIYDYFLGASYKNDPVVTKGLVWLTKNYDVQKNPKKTSFAYLYYLYGLERVGMLYGTELIGNYEWYPDGANHLLSIEKPGGGWHAGDSIPREPHVDTCFAILFLRRGTPPLKPVATGGSKEAPPGAPVANNEPNAGRGGLAGARTPVDTVAPGWRLSNYVKPGPRTPLIADARGKSNVLVTYPLDLKTPITLKRAIELAAGQKTTLKIMVGHHESSTWTLIVRADGKELVKKVVGPSTTVNGWTDVTVDLSTLSGAPLVEVQGVPGGHGLDVCYFGEVLILDK
ncbi:MAG TPA: prenyltransferase/squalene oxidase repeat-containing protein [Planctomycetota bacterium]